VAQIWRESRPAVVNEHGFVLPRKATPVSIWWGATMLGTLTSRVARGLSTLELDSLACLGIVEGLAWSIAGVCFIYMVWNAQKRQEAQWQDLELRRTVPAPNADVLR